MLEAYRAHVADRAQEGLPPKALSAEQVSQLVELLKAPPAGEEATLLELLTERVPPGVDDAAYVKAAFLADVAKGEANSSLINAEEAVRLLGTSPSAALSRPPSPCMGDGRGKTSQNPYAHFFSTRSSAATVQCST